ncbi:fibroblast growth factor receptor homolog 1-like, partial [Mizuhopecten yessoensis]|uniref:fibroblast growth factor receptor homolog 1-like n=1 Tax=Mizuhopecten yessoensis TaxID=6573 RepID=UPI000B45F1CD
MSDITDLTDDDDSHHRSEFLREIALMKKIGYHTNVVSMLGCCTLCDPVCVVVEHMANGDLQSYLKAIRSSIRERDHTQHAYVNRDVDLLGPTDLLSFARQISIGM